MVGRLGMVPGHRQFGGPFRHATLQFLGVALQVRMEPAHFL